MRKDANIPSQFKRMVETVIDIIGGLHMMIISRAFVYDNEKKDVL